MKAEGQGSNGRIAIQPGGIALWFCSASVSVQYFGRGDIRGRSNVPGNQDGMSTALRVAIILGIAAAVAALLLLAALSHG